MSYSFFDFIVFFISLFLVVHLFICQFGVVWIIEIMNVGFSSFVFSLSTLFYHYFAHITFYILLAIKLTIFCSILLVLIIVVFLFVS